MVKELTKKGQFVEIDMTARINQTGEVFDTTIKEEAKKINMPLEKVGPLTVCIGQEMVLKGLDKALEGKERGKKYSIELQPKEAFGNRNASLVKILPLAAFLAKGVKPYPGLSLNMDGVIARISAVSGGRVITDFNNPLSGKAISYEFTIKRIVTKDNEKINCMTTFFLKEDPSKVVKSVKEGKAEIQLKGHYPKKAVEDISEKMSKLSGLKVEIKTA